MDGTRKRGRPKGTTGIPRADSRSNLPRGESGVWGNGTRTITYLWSERCGHHHVAPTQSYAREPMYVQRPPRIERYLYAPPSPRAVRRGTLADAFYGMRGEGFDAIARARRAELERRRVRALHAEHALGAPSCDDASFHTQTERAPSGKRGPALPHAPSFHRAADERCARCVVGLDAPRTAPQLTATTRALLARGNAFVGVAGRARNAYASALRRAMRDAELLARDVADNSGA